MCSATLCGPFYTVSDEMLTLAICSCQQSYARACVCDQSPTCLSVTCSNWLTNSRRLGECYYAVFFNCYAITRWARICDWLSAVFITWTVCVNLVTARVNLVIARHRLWLPGCVQANNVIARANVSTTEWLCDSFWFDHRSITYFLCVQCPLRFLALFEVDHIYSYNSVT